ncbi:MAG TPA: alpha/beta hydrolase [Polyangiales bacterium]
MSSKGKRRVGIIAALSLGALAMLMPFAGRLFGRPRVRYTYDTGALGADAAAKLVGVPGWSRTSLEVAPGVSLNGLVRKPSDSAAPWLFFLSGNDGTLLTTAQKFIERVRGGADFGAAVYAYRGYDSSSGVPEREDIARDMRMAYERLLSDQKLKPQQVHVAAFSLGGYFGARLLSELADDPKRPASLSLLAPAEFIVMVRKGSALAEKLAPGDLIEMQPLLESVPAPVLVVQGSGDQTTGVEMGRTVAKKLGERAKYVELDGVGHIALQENDDAAKAVREFMLSATKAR